MAEAQLIDEASPSSGSDTQAGRLALTVENMTCGNCMAKVERTLKGVVGVRSARVNLSAKRVVVEFDPSRVRSGQLVDALAGAGYRAADLSGTPSDLGETRERDLMRRIAVAGFAAGNIMLLSVAVWAGVVSDMGPAASAFLHWISALIALPAVVYAGQPFFRSALDAVKVRRFNMDVPISVAVSLATAMSLFQTIMGREQVYFDAAVTLLLFLLIGRFLDQRMRVKAAGAAYSLIAIKSERASLIDADGQLTEVPAKILKPGMRVHVAAGARFPVDGTLVEGRSDVDESLITGETAPRRLAPGGHVFEGTVNMTGPVTVEVTAAESNTLLAEIGRLMESAEQARGRYVLFADRAARIYAPAVHILGLTTFIGWMIVGAGWQPALTAAIAVLIITCPCALALAVPAVQITAAARLFAQGIIVKSGDGLDRLSEVDTVVFDKTGTLTLGEPELVSTNLPQLDDLRHAASLAAASSHPYARALVRAVGAKCGPVAVATGVKEFPGRGLIRQLPSGEERLGSAEFVGAASASNPANLWYRAPDGAIRGFAFHDQIRADARDTIAKLIQGGYQVAMLSGDTPERALASARDAGIADAEGGLKPQDKLSRLAGMKAKGRSILMVGDGLNDAPALAAGHASLSPSTASDITMTAADVVWQGAALKPVAELLAVAREGRRMAVQNFGVALAYNAVCVPLAMLGYVTPLVAALAMSTSSIVVTANAVRLRSKTCRLEAPRA